MNKVKVLVDSTCDLSSSLAKKYDLEIIPLYVTMGDKTVKDDDAVSANDLFDYVNKTGELPKTSAINVHDYVEKFQPWLDKGYDICFTSISSELSSTFQNAFLAAQELNAEDRIFLIDSRSLSSGVAHVAIKMAEFRDQGLSAKEIQEKVQNEVVDKVSASFFVSQLDYLYKGGRCTLLASIVASALKICPQLVLKDGKIIPCDKYRGSWKKVLKHYYEATINDRVKYQKDIAFITHTSFDKTQEIDELKHTLLDEFGFETVHVCNAGSTIASHCGPGTLGVLFLQEME